MNMAYFLHTNYDTDILVLCTGGEARLADSELLLIKTQPTVYLEEQRLRGKQWATIQSGNSYWTTAL
jgi:hypothetical protein